MRVTVVGAAGGIGQPLSLLIKQNPLVSALSLYDVAPAAGVAADVSHVDTASSVVGYTGDAMGEALKGADVVVIPAGVPRKPGMTRDDLFAVNAGIIMGIARAIAANCPRAMVLVITNPVNSTVPIVAEALRAAGCFNPAKVVGVTTLDLMRSRAFIGERLGRDPRSISVDVVGGHSGTTIVPILSTLAALPESEHGALTEKIQNAGTVVVEAKAGKGSATLSMAAAAAHFVGRVLAGLSGEQGVRECAYVATSTVSGVDFFALPCTFGPRGVMEVHNVLTGLTTAEEQRVASARGILETQIKKGLDFAKSKL